MDTLLDSATNWLAAHPRITTAMVCAFCLMPMFLETPR